MSTEAEADVEVNAEDDAEQDAHNHPPEMNRIERAEEPQTELQEEEEDQDSPKSYASKVHDLESKAHQLLAASWSPKRNVGGAGFGQGQGEDTVSNSNSNSSANVNGHYQWRHHHHRTPRQLRQRRAASKVDGCCYDVTLCCAECCNDCDMCVVM